MSSGGLRPFVDLRQSSAAQTILDDPQVSGMVESVGSVDGLGVEYLPYASGEFTTQAALIRSPSDLTAGNITDTSATVQWNPSSDNAEAINGYDVQYRQDGSSNWISAGFTSSTFTTVTGLTPSTSYDVEVNAVDAAGSMGAPTQANNLFSTSSFPAPQPTGPADESTGQSTNPTFTWDAAAGATGGYNVIVDSNPADLPINSTANAGTTAAFVGHTPLTSAAVTSPLVADTTYYWEVQGVTGSGITGPWSSINSFTTGGPEISLSGNGQAITPGLSTPTLTNGTDLGSTMRGSSPLESTFTIQNTGDSPLTLGNVKVPHGFGLISSPPRTLAAGDSASFSVRLSATTVGTFGGAVSFPDNVPTHGENPFTFDIEATVMKKGEPIIGVSGNGQQIDHGKGSPSALNGTNFGSDEQGSDPIVNTFTIDNTGNAPLTVGAVKVPRGFTLVDAPPSSIAAGESGTFAVGLSTVKPGTFNGSISIANNDPQPGEHPFAFAVRGVVGPGTAPAITVLGNGQVISTGQSSTTANNGTDFGTVNVGSPPPISTFTIENDGDATLKLGTLRIPAGFAVIRHPPKSIAAGASATFMLRLDTNRAGTFGGTVSFSDNDPRAAESPFTFAISGIVLPKTPAAG